MWCKKCNRETEEKNVPFVVQLQRKTFLMSCIGVIIVKFR